MLVLVLMWHASVDLFVLSFVLPCAYAYVDSENQALYEHLRMFTLFILLCLASMFCVKFKLKNAINIHSGKSFTQGTIVENKV